MIGLRSVALLVLFVWVSTYSAFAQNPFDVYRGSTNAISSTTSTPNLLEKSAPTATNTITEQELLDDFEEPILEESDKALAVLDDPNPTDRLSDNPFDVYKGSAPTGDRLTVDLTKMPDKELSSSIDHTTAKAKKPIPLSEVTPKAKEDTQLSTRRRNLDILASPNSTNPFDKTKENDSTGFEALKPAISDEKEAEAGALPKNKKVKGYFNNILTNYIFWVLLVFLLLLTVVVNLNRNLIPDLSKSLVNDNFLRVTYREYSKGFTPILYYLLYGNYFAQAGLFFYLSQSHFSADHHYSWLTFIGGLSGAYLFKHSTLWTIGHLFPVRKETSQFSFVIMQFNLFLGLLFFGLNWLLAFGPETIVKPFIFTGLGVFGAMYLLRQFRGLLLSARILTSHKFHFFIYLCAVEIAPILLLYKFIATNFV